MSELILMYVVESLIFENLYLTVTNSIKLSGLEESYGHLLIPGSCSGCHLGGHLGFSYLDMPGVILILSI